MKIKKVLTLSVLLLMGVVAVAQTPKYEVSVHYSFLHYNPAKSLTGSENLNGGGGSFVYNFGKLIGIKAEFGGYASTQQTFHVVASPPLVPRTGTFTTQANLFTYLFGPQINVPVHKVRVSERRYLEEQIPTGTLTCFKLPE